MYSGYRNGHVAYSYDKAAVAVYSYKIALETGKDACGNAEPWIACGIMVERVHEKAYPRWNKCRYLHEMLHDPVGNDGSLMGAAVVDKMQQRKFFFKKNLYLILIALYKYQAADSLLRLFYNTLVLADILYGFVYKGVEISIFAKYIHCGIHL